jgi:PAS domain S-box-containing protein
LRVFTLKGAEQPYRVMVETMSEGAVTAAPDGVVLYCNQRFAEMVKTRSETIMGSSLLAHVADEDAEKLAAAFVLSRTGTPRLRTTLLASDGTRVPANVAMHSRTDGNTQSIAIVVTDLTAIAASQAELARHQQHLEEMVTARTADLAHANAELETFAYSVSHDLRAPLRAVDGFSQMLLHDYADKLDSEGRRKLQIVRDGAARMGKMIDDILAFSRIGRHTMAAAETDMGSQVQAILQELAPAMAGRTIEMKVGPLPNVSGDAEMLRRVWTNLLDNAIKFSGHKPSAVIEVGSDANGDEIVFFVRDTGDGFDMQYVDKLFGVFQRLHGPEQFLGTGIGLAIVKRIVTRHGGRVWAEGKAGEGATFYFALPRGDGRVVRAA